MNRKQLIRALAACSALAGASFGQAGVFSGFRTDRYVTPNVTGQLLSLEAGRLDGDMRMDALLRTSTTLAVVIGPSLFEAYSTFGAGSTSCAVVHEPSQDSVAACDADGLKLWSWDANAGGMAATLASGGNWVGATCVQAVPHEEGNLIVALAADSKTIVSGLWKGDLWTEQAPLVLPSVSRRVVAFDFNGDGQHEYGVVGDSGFNVFKVSGSVVPNSYAPDVGGGEFLLRIPGTDGPDSLLYAIPVGPYTYMSVFSNAGFEPSQPLGDLFVDVQAADWDDDGELDLLWTSATAQNTWIMYGRHAGLIQSPVDLRFDLDIDDHEVVITHSSAGEYLIPGETPRPFEFKAVADFDADGDMDVFAGSNDVSWEFRLSMIEGAGEVARRPEVEACRDANGTLMHCDVEHGLSNETGEILDTVFSWNTLVFADSIPEAQRTHLEVVCYLQSKFTQYHTGSSNPSYVSTTPSVFEFELGPYPENAINFAVDVAGVWCPDLAYHFALTAIRKENGVVTARGPTLVGVFVEDANLSESLEPALTSERIYIGYGDFGEVDALSGGVNERPVIRPTPPTQPPSGGG